MSRLAHVQVMLLALLVACSAGGRDRDSDEDTAGETPSDMTDMDSPVHDMDVEAVDGLPEDLPVDREEEPDLPVPLAVNAANPRYLDDGTGRALLLVGANHGWELQDNAWEIDYTLDFTAFLDYLASYNLNYIRLWRAESAMQTADDRGLTTPMPYLRTGPGSANDGQPRFDLTLFNDAYFDRLRARCLEARDRGMFVDVRAAMGQCLAFAERMGLVDMVPMNALASSLYCLANQGQEYLVFVPDGGPVDVDLSGAGALHAEWLEVETGTVHDGGDVSGGDIRTLTPPFAGSAVLYLVE